MNRPALAWLRRRDYFGDPSVPLADCARDLVARRTGRRPTGPVRLLTHLRMFGHAFNPVSFYFCFDEDGETLAAVIAEVTSTPWRERHLYVLDIARAERVGEALRFRSAKALHVSPFLPMDLEHLWTLTIPGRRLVVQVDDLAGADRPFDATLTLERREIDGPALAFALARFPFLTVRIVVAIYFQALRLWLKGATFHPHPKRAAVAPNAEGPAR